jgi:hypothetical protein
MDTGFKRLSEANVFGTPKQEQQIKKSSIAVLGAVEQSYGIYQVPSYRQLVTTLWGDPLLVKASLLFSQQVVSRGVFYTANPKYKLVLNGKTALDVIKEWCDKNNIDIKLFEIALEMYAFGNSFWRITNLGFVKIPIEAIWHAVRVEPDTPLQEQYNIQVTAIYGGRVIPYNEFKHFRIFTTGYHAPFGQGILQSMLANPVDSKGVVCPSLYDIRLGLRASLHEGIMKFSIGNELWSFPDMSNEDFEAQEIGKHIAEMSTTGNRIATNTKGTISLAVPERAQSYDIFVTEQRNEIFMALGEPSLKLGLEEGFTKSTAESATSIHELEISYCRNNIKENLNDLFKQILDNQGYDGTEAAVQINFGIEEIADYEIKDVFEAVKNKIILANEARTLLSKYHKWEIEGDIESGDKPAEDKKTLPINKVSIEPKVAKESVEETLPNFIVTELSDSIANYNYDYSKIYKDTLVPEWMDKPLWVHETSEIEMLKRGLEYEEAHAVATMLEHKECTRLGIDWDKYNNEYKGLLNTIRARDSKQPADISISGKRGNK